MPKKAKRANLMYAITGRCPAFDCGAEHCRMVARQLEARNTDLENALHRILFDAKDYLEAIRIASKALAGEK